jgi:hypothetical protein
LKFEARRSSNEINLGSEAGSRVEGVAEVRRPSP